MLQLASISLIYRVCLYTSIKHSCSFACAVHCNLFKFSEQVVSFSPLTCIRQLGLQVKFQYVAAVIHPSPSADPAFCRRRWEGALDTGSMKHEHCWKGEKLSVKCRVCLSCFKLIWASESVSECLWLLSEQNLVSPTWQHYRRRKKHNLLLL